MINCNSKHSTHTFIQSARVALVQHD